MGGNPEEKSTEETKNYDNLRRLQIKDLFEKEMGFALVVEELIKAQKPIIGHNMIYDIIYLYN